MQDTDLEACARRDIVAGFFADGFAVYGDGRIVGCRRVARAGDGAAGKDRKKPPMFSDVSISHDED